MGLTDTFTPKPEVQKLIVDGLSGKMIESGEYHGDFFLKVSSDHYLNVIDFLRTHGELQFDSFVDLCGVDYLGQTPRFEVVVHLFSQPKQIRIRVRCQVPDSTETIPSLTSRWKGANWQEREAYDMYGIRFDGHPELKRILSAPEVKDFPQRKDFPLRGAREEKFE